MKPLIVCYTAALASSALLPACTKDPCDDDLAAICAVCTDASYKASCDTVVATKNESLCSSNKTVFQGRCPTPLTTSSSSAAATSGSTSTGTSTASATSASTGAGGAGGKGGAGGTGGTAGSGGTAGKGGS